MLDLSLFNPPRAGGEGFLKFLPAAAKWRWRGVRTVSVTLVFCANALTFVSAVLSEGCLALEHALGLLRECQRVGLLGLFVEQIFQHLPGLLRKAKLQIIAGDLHRLIGGDGIFPGGGQIELGPHVRAQPAWASRSALQAKINIVGIGGQGLGDQARVDGIAGGTGDVGFERQRALGRGGHRGVEFGGRIGGVVDRQEPHEAGLVFGGQFRIGGQGDEELAGAIRLAAFLQTRSTVTRWWRSYCSDRRGEPCEAMRLAFFDNKFTFISWIREGSSGAGCRPRN